MHTAEADVAKNRGLVGGMDTLVEDEEANLQKEQEEMKAIEDRATIALDSRQEMVMEEASLAHVVA